MYGFPGGRVPTARFISTLLMTLALGGVAHLARAVEIIQLRTGQVGGVPGTCSGLDDSWTYNSTAMQSCPQPFRNGPFTAADFAGAVAGPQAQVVTHVGNGSWMASLAFDPLARWIDWLPVGNCWGFAASVLYAAPFTVNTPNTGCGLTATIEICWAVDDYLGDPVGPNTIGIYLNGTPLDPGFSGGNYAEETCYTQYNVPVNNGLNRLYAYQRDGACSISGLLLSARITVNPPLPCPQLVISKFEDLNGDGIWDGNEPPLSGWTFNVSGPVETGGTTDASGTVTFPCLPPGQYVITEVTQPGWVITTPPSGSYTINITCEQDFAVTFGNRRCGVDVLCSHPPSCMTAQFPMNECGGTLVNEVAANKDGTLQGGAFQPTWTTGRPGSACGLRFSTVGEGWVECADAAEHDFGTGSFTIAAWVRSTDGGADVRTIVDKRDNIGGSVLGYVFYLYEGKAYFQYDDATAGWTTHGPNPTYIADGAWHHVSVSVCRNPDNPSSNSARIMVDSTIDPYGAATIPTGSLSNTVGLRIGQRSPDYFPAPTFNGDIDDVLLFKCCLTPAQILALQFAAEHCSEMCYLPSVHSTAGNTVQTTLKLCNYSLTPQTYAWTIAGAPAGAGCSINGPTLFSPTSGTVTLPAANNGPACMNIPITIQVPGNLLGGQTACYEVTTQNLSTGRCCTARGMIVKIPGIEIDPDPTEVAIRVDTPTMIAFTVQNPGPDPLLLNYLVVTRSSDGDDDNNAVRLNGLPPGVPVKGTLFVAGGDVGTIDVEATLVAFQPLNINEVVLVADVDGDGTAHDLEVCSLVSAPEPDATAVPDDAVVEVPEAPSAMLFLSPNPFREATTLRLVLTASESAARVEIFDAGGRLVRRIFTGELKQGEHHFEWNGQDEQGRRSPLGLYFVGAVGRGMALERKLIRLN